MNNKKNNSFKIIIKIFLCLCFMIVISFFLDLESKAAKNVGKFLEQIYIVDTKQLILEDEVIDVDVVNGKVSCKYTLYNPLENVIKTKIKFPVRVNNINKKDVNNIKNTTNFNAFINNTKIVIKEEEEKNDIRNYDYWYTFEVTLEGNTKKDINVTYDVVWQLDDDYSVLIGCVRTEGGLFKDNIKHTKVTFDFGKLMDYYIITPDDNSVYKKIGTKYIWEASDYLPNEDIALIMKPKMLENNKIKLDYYSAYDKLKDKRVLIDDIANYTKSKEEENITKKAAEDLKIMLEKYGVEAAIYSKLSEFESKINGEAEFDYVITLICKSSTDPNVNLKTVGFEGLEKDNQDKYIKSKKLSMHIVNSGLNGIAQMFENLKSNKLLEQENILNLEEDIDFSIKEYTNVPRVIVSLGYITDFKKSYENYQGILEKITLGLAIFNEDEDINKTNETFITKNDYKVEVMEKNFFNSLFSRINKFFKYNIVTIIISLFLGSIIGIAVFVIVINMHERKMQNEYIVKRMKNEKLKSNKEE